MRDVLHRSRDRQSLTGMVRPLLAGRRAMIETVLSIGLLPAVCDLPGPPKAKKPTWWNTPRVSHHVGLLFDKPPGRTGLSFI